VRVEARLIGLPAQLLDFDAAAVADHHVDELCPSPVVMGGAAVEAAVLAMHAA
jgi:hypothetical protein